MRRSEAFLAEGQRLARTGSFSWRVGRRTKSLGRSSSIASSSLTAAVPVTLERIGAESIRKTSRCWRK